MTRKRRGRFPETDEPDEGYASGSPGVPVLKIVSVILVLVTVSMLALFVLGKVDPLAFWIWMAVLAAVAYMVVPAIRKR